MRYQCVVTNCKSDNKRKKKCSTFHVPKDIDMRKKWEESIPGIVELQQTDRLCEQHFNHEDIVRAWIKLDANDQVIARVTYKRMRLNEFAVPTRFNDVSIEKENFMPEHGYAKQVSNFEINYPSTVSSFRVTKPSIQGISTCIDIPDVTSSISVGTDIRLLLSPMKILICESIVADLSVLEKLAEVSSHMEISKRE